MIPDRICFECNDPAHIVVGAFAYCDPCAPARLADFTSWGRCSSCRGNTMRLGGECRHCYEDRTGREPDLEGKRLWR